MTLDDFRARTREPSPPPDLSPALLALWHDARGEWDAAHRAVQGDPGAEAAWVHAYLHRKEGDLANAGYWYRRAARGAADGNLDEEWGALAAALLEHAAD